MAARKSPRVIRPLADRLLRRLEADTNGGCWLWSGAVDDRGYGSIKLGPNRGSERTHRVAYAAFNGPIPPSLVVMHACDVKVCCNPRHLSLGTQAQNVRDGIARGRRLYRSAQ